MRKGVIYKALRCLLGFILIVQTTSAQVSVKDLAGQLNVITPAVPLLLISPDSRSSALGDAGVASTPDVNSMHWNAAKMARLDKEMGFSISYTPWLRELVDDIYLAYLSGFKQIDNKSTVGLSLRYFSLGNIQFTDQNGQTLGQANPNEFVVEGGYARSFGRRFSGGMTGKFIYSNLTQGQGPTGSKAGMSGAADVSVYYLNDDMKIKGKGVEYAAGLNISNIGAKISYTQSGDKGFLPMNYRIGNSLKANLDDYNEMEFLLDFNKLLVPTPPSCISQATCEPSNIGVAGAIFESWVDAPGKFKEEMNEWTISAGLEWWYDKQFAIRGGYFYEHELKGNRKYVTVGAGLQYNVVNLDLSFLVPAYFNPSAVAGNHPLKNTLRFTLIFNFDKGSSSSSDEKPKIE